MKNRKVFGWVSAIMLVLSLFVPMSASAESGSFTVTASRGCDDNSFNVAFTGDAIPDEATVSAHNRSDGGHSDTYTFSPAAGITKTVDHHNWDVVYIQITGMGGPISLIVGDCTTGAASETISFSGTDTDNDGIPDNSDRCPTVNGEGSDDGCPRDAVPDGWEDITFAEMDLVIEFCRNGQDESATVWQILNNEVVGVYVDATAHDRAYIPWPLFVGITRGECTDTNPGNGNGQTELMCPAGTTFLVKFEVGSEKVVSNAGVTVTFDEDSATFTTSGPLIGAVVIKSGSPGGFIDREEYNPPVAPGDEPTTFATEGGDNISNVSFCSVTPPVVTPTPTPTQVVVTPTPPVDVTPTPTQVVVTPTPPVDVTPTATVVVVVPPVEVPPIVTPSPSDSQQSAVSGLPGTGNVGSVATNAPQEGNWIGAGVGIVAVLCAAFAIRGTVRHSRRSA